MMRSGFRLGIAVVTLLSLVPEVTAQSSVGAKLSRAELRQLERSAHTAQQYQDLAAYFHAREAACRLQADGEMEEWTRRMQFVSSLYAKYPSPADSSRNRYEYFEYGQHQMKLRAARYEDAAAAAAK